MKPLTILTMKVFTKDRFYRDAIRDDESRTYKRLLGHITALGNHPGPIKNYLVQYVGFGPAMSRWQREVLPLY